MDLFLHVPSRRIGSFNLPATVTESGRICRRYVMIMMQERTIFVEKRIKKGKVVFVKAMKE
jgi:hypothetical protein